MAAIAVPRLPQDFLAWEEAQEERYELLNGVVRMMTGGSFNHNAICAGLFIGLRNVLRKSDLPRRCLALAEGAKVKINDRDYLYPDAAMVCGELPSGRDTLVTAPILVAEVLSPSTESRDRTEKLRAYQGLASLRYVLFVSSERVLVELLTRDEGAEIWRHAGAWGRFADAVPLDAIGISLTLAAIYDGTDGLAELTDRPDRPLEWEEAEAAEAAARASAPGAAAALR